ncbi:MAG TPA: Crp/Fnr family transcriptional regulator [Candidatus Dormibacteraeota bacterium]|jgi:CRP-like cAMP-binding protein|nr:Crp/Fnr family transcriptional regulator [Candidatus Dormibacteraeota bacterium]
MLFRIAGAPSAVDRTIDEAILASFLGDLPQRTVEELLVNSSVIEVPARSFLLHPGDARLWLLVEGLVRISIHASDGRQLVVHHAVPGETVGLGSIFATDGSEGAQALGECRLLPLDWERVRTMTQHDPAMATAVATEVTRRLRSELEATALGNHRSVRARIAGYALDLIGRMPGEMSTLPLSQQELADAVGASREAVARSLSALRSLGAIATGARRLHVLRPDLLREELGPRRGPTIELAHLRRRRRARELAGKGVVLAGELTAAAALKARA